MQKTNKQQLNAFEENKQTKNRGKKQLEDCQFQNFTV